MNDLISRKVMIDEIRLIEKDLLQDKNDAENSDDGEMMFAINNQLNVLWRVKSRVRGLPTACDEIKDYILSEQKEPIGNTEQLTIGDKIRESNESVARFIYQYEKEHQYIWEIEDYLNQPYTE